MKEKLLAQLIVKYPGVSKKFLGLLAEKQSTKVTDENQIEGVINELEKLPISVTDLAAEWQKEGDTRVIEAKKEWVKNPPKPDKPPKTDPPPTDPTNDDMPAWAKTLIDQNKTLAEKISGFEKEKTQGTIKQQAATKLKDIPAKYYENWQLPESEDQLDAFVEKVTTGYEGFKQDLTNQGLSLVGTPPAAGGGAAGAGKVHPSIKAFADKRAELEKQVQTK